MEILVVLIIGSILIVILNKMPSKASSYHFPSFPKSVVGLFSRFKKAEEKGVSDEKEEARLNSKKEDMRDKAENFLKSEQLKEAEDAYIEVLKIDKKDLSSYKGLGKICLLKKNYGHALEVFKKISELSPNDSSSYCNAGICYFKEKKFKKAKENYEKALELERKPSYFKNLGIVLNSMKKYEEAADSLKESLKEEKDEDSLKLAIKIIPKIKDRKKAKNILQFLLKLDPDSAVLKRELSRLK